MPHQMSSQEGVSLCTKIQRKDPVARFFLLTSAANALNSRCSGQMLQDPYPQRPTALAYCLDGPCGCNNRQCRAMTSPKHRDCCHSKHSKHQKHLFASVASCHANSSHPKACTCTVPPIPDTDKSKAVRSSCCYSHTQQQQTPCSSRGTTCQHCCAITPKLTKALVLRT